MDGPLEKISDNVWKLKADGNVYFVDFPDDKIIIDAGARANRHIFNYLEKVTPFDKVTKVIFTHMHYDHVGNFDFFTNAEFFASKSEIDDFRKNPFDTILSEDMSEKIKDIKLKPIDDADIKKFEIIDTPGHTRGSICIWYDEKKILFSGDTMLNTGLGRVDLPTSSPKDMKISVHKLLSYNYKILCTGHEY